MMIRRQETTKHDYGHALLVAGAYGRCGCAILAARAALRSGCGLISVHLPQRCVEPMQAAFPEAMVSIDPSPTLFSQPAANLDRYAAVAIGPGIGIEEQTVSAMFGTIEQLPHDIPIVLDADALNIAATHLEELPHDRKIVATPHAGEYKRMFGTAEPKAMAEKHGLILVCKAHQTKIYSPDGRSYTNRTGNAGMATAGSGDVLTGILLGMLTKGEYDVFETTCKAVEIHGKIGDIAIEKQTESSLIASDMIENLKYISTDKPSS